MNPITLLVNKLMIPFLAFSYNSIFANYGIAILLLTILVKIIFYPLTRKFLTSKHKAQDRWGPSPQLVQSQQALHRAGAA